MTASLTKWYEEHGRHAIYAGGKAVPLPDSQHTLVLNEDHVKRGLQYEETATVSHTATDEKMMKNEELRNRQMAKLYREQVLKQQPVDLIQIGPTPAKASKQPEAELVLVGRLIARARICDTRVTECRMRATVAKV